MDNNIIINLIFQLEEFCRLEPKWKEQLIKVNEIYEKYGDISYLEIEDNLIFIDENGEIVGGVYIE